VRDDGDTGHARDVDDGCGFGGADEREEGLGHEKRAFNVNLLRTC
jgi:hypothetical protein